MRGQTFTGNTRTPPLWFGDSQDPNPLVRFPAKVDAAQFVDGAAVVVTANGVSAIGATTVPVDAIPNPVNSPTPLSTGQVAIPVGAILLFGAAGSGKFAKLTANALVGATSLAVEALVTAIADNDVARYSRWGRKYIPSGTLIGRTYAERDASTAFGPWTAGDDEAFLTFFDILDANEENDVELTRHGLVVKENYLPGWATLAAGTQTRIRELYRCIKGVD